MGWEEEITAMLQDASDSVVRFDIEQNLTSAEKNVAKSNVGIGATVTNISGDDYRIEIGW